MAEAIEMLRLVPAMPAVLAFTDPSTLADRLAPEDLAVSQVRRTTAEHRGALVPVHARGCRRDGGTPAPSQKRHPAPRLHPGPRRQVHRLSARAGKISVHPKKQVVSVLGSFEIPVAAHELGNSGKCDAILCIGDVYTSVGQEGPAVLLVHVCGASLQHCRDNIGIIADEGQRVWATTLLGFGRSEKPNDDYIELLWSELLWDFIVDVVKEPVHLVGNSIGGYICALLLAYGLLLQILWFFLNSAASVPSSH